MNTFSRADRVSGQIHKALSDILRKKIKDPRLEMTTITDVKLSSDLRLAKIYFISTGDKTSREEAIEAFEHALGYVKRTLARQLGLRYMPDLQIFYDDSFDYGSHIDSVLNLINRNNGSNNSSFEK
jgi:ribosome-binding factor A